MSSPRRPPREDSGRAAAASDLVRMGAFSAGVAGAAWAASGVLDLASASGLSGPGLLGAASLRNALYLLALAGTLGGLVGLHARQAPGYGRLGTFGFSLAFTGTALLLAGLALSFLSKGGSTWQAFLDWTAGLGLWGAIVGALLLGLATLRLGALPRWCGWLLVFCAPLAIVLGDYGGGVVLGIEWLALGYALFYLRDVSALLRDPRGRPGRRR